MVAPMRGKRAGLLALAAALATMLGLGVTLGVTQRGDATGCAEAALGGSRAEHAELAADCDALLASRAALAGGRALNWSAGAALAEWDGVTVSGEPPRVVGLDLRAGGLRGVLPTQLGSLTALTDLALSGGNAFAGCIPGPLWAAETHDLAALGLTTCTDGTIGDEETIKFGTAIGPGTYKVSLDAWKLEVGEGKNFIFSVPEGLRIELRYVGHSSSSCWGECPPVHAMIHGENGEFVVCVEVETAEECGRGHKSRAAELGEPTDEYGRPLRTTTADEEVRIEMLEPMIDQMVASAHIEDAR